MKPEVVNLPLKVSFISHSTSFHNKENDSGSGLEADSEVKSTTNVTVLLVSSYRSFSEGAL